MDNVFSSFHWELIKPSDHFVFIEHLLNIQPAHVHAVDHRIDAAICWPFSGTTYVRNCFAVGK